MFDVAKLDDDILVEYDMMMIEATPRIVCFSRLATALWVQVLRELEKRRKVQITSGSLDDIGNALITRLY
jgi:hypothetical protein